MTVLTRPDREQGEEDHAWPEALPGGRAVLFTITSATGDAGAAEIAVLDLATGTHAVVLRGGSHAQYVARRSAGAGPTGYLVYAAGGTLRAVAFDLETGTTRGTPVPVVPDVVTTVNPPAAGGVQAAVAVDGTLAYVRAGAGGTERRTLTWVDRQGRETAFAAPPAEYVQPRLSPDGSRLAVAVFNEDLWVGDVAHQTLARLTFMPGREYFHVWGPDGRRLFFSSDQDGVRNLYVQAADGTGTAERLTTSPNEQYASGVTPDGTRLLFTERSPQTGFDIMQIELAGSRTVTPLVQTPATEDNGVVSPDGRWLAYQANDSGTVEIYVRPYPGVASGRWQVSTGGGTQPVWSRGGQELFYVAPTGALMRVGVERGTSWGATPPTAVLKDGAVLTLGEGPRQYDVSPDGQRFLVLRDVPTPDAAPPQLIVIQHFDALLQRLVPEQE
ncbi:MAG: TolB family protein [Vicinamibacterales bacterium]